MVKAILISVTLATAMLTGCASLSADVHTGNAASAVAALQGERTYSITRMLSQEAGADHPPFENLLVSELAKQGFVELTGKPARYLLSIAYETRPAAIGVGVKDCPTGECSLQPEAPFSVFGGRAYQHALTLRIFERASGREIYKVSSASSDRDASPLHAMPALVKSALAKFPFDAPGDWRVRLRADETGGEPTVVSVKPL